MHLPRSRKTMSYARRCLVRCTASTMNISAMSGSVSCTPLPNGTPRLISTACLKGRRASRAQVARERKEQGRITTMCGIAGLIHRDGATSVGKEMTAMLSSLRHRGPDSTGFAVYGASTPNEYVMRLKLAEQEDLTKNHHIRQKIRDRQVEVDKMLAELGAETVEVAEATPYAFRYRLRYAGDTRRLATEIEKIEGAEVLSFGSALELIKDLGDA